MNEKGRSDQDLSIKIKTPQGDWTTTFPKTAKVSEVLQAVIQHFGFSANGKYALRLETDPNNALKADRPLVSYGVKDGDVLIFTDTGVGVWR